MKHKYLCELFPEDELPFPYCEPDYPDFDERSTFNMDYALIAWLYECLRYFQDEVSKIVDLEWQGQLFEIDDEYLTQRQCIDRMVDDIKEFYKASDDALNEYSELEDAKNAGALSNEEFNNKFKDSCNTEDRRRDSAKDDLFKVLSKCFWAMWL